MGMQLSDCLSRENILFEIESTSQQEVMEQMIKQIRSTGGTFDTERAMTAIQARHSLLPTVIVPGVALVHARLDDLIAPQVAIATSSTGVPFTCDRISVNVVLMILTPKNDPTAFLRILSMLSRNLRDIDVPEFIQTATLRDLCSLFNSVGEVRDYLIASDVMNKSQVTLNKEDTLDAAIHALCTNKVHDIPVVDDAGDLCGVIAMEDLMRQGISQEILWEDDLTPILRLEPIIEMMQKDHETHVSDFMTTDFISVQPDAPAARLVKIFLKSSARQIQVLDGRRLVGVVNLSGFTPKLFWA